MHILLISVVAATFAVAHPSDDAPHPEQRARCIQSMQLSPADVETGLHEYRLIRCIEESVAREQQSARLRRAEERLERLEGETRGRIREGKRFLSPANRERFDADNPPAPRNDRAFSRRQLLRSLESFTTEEARKARSLLQQERMTQARAACRNVPRSFYQNCVRETIRTLGESEKN